MPRVLLFAAEVRKIVAGYTSESDYLAELVRRDVQEGTVAPKMTKRQWDDLLTRAA